MSYPAIIGCIRAAGSAGKTSHPITAARCLLLLAAWLITAPLSAAQVLTDDLGHRVSLKAPPQRIVSLTPHITELLYAAGAGDRLVAAVDYSDYPEAAKSLPRIGNAERVDHERLLQLQPDLIIAWGSGTPALELEALRRLNIPLYLSEPRRLDAIGVQLREFGAIAGTVARSEKAARDYEQRLTALRARYAANPKRTVFYQLAQQPLLTVNREHLINDVLSVCGGVNPFAELPALTPRVAIEAVLAARPEAIVFALYTGESDAAVRTFWEDYGLPATTRFIGIPGDYIHRATPRVLEGVERICAGLR